LLKGVLVAFRFAIAGYHETIAYTDSIRILIRYQLQTTNGAAIQFPERCKSHYDVALVAASATLST
jgi:hypothetical protein